LFQLRLHFVLGERIGIDEIDAEQLLTIGSHRARTRDHIASENSIAAAAPTAGATCSASDSISFSKNESESRKSARRDS
jgi:hypothetical protein